jgi:hypothetical protein
MLPFHKPGNSRKLISSFCTDFDIFRKALLLKFIFITTFDF